MEGNTGYTKSYWIYAQNTGPYDEVVVEWKYDNLQAMGPAWKVWHANTRCRVLDQSDRQLPDTHRQGSSEIQTSDMERFHVQPRLL
jgi:hypothetical protein